MNKILYLILFSGLFCLMSCTSAPQQAEQPTITDDSVAGLARLVESSAIPVRGYGLVAGLYGTGSAECPPELRQELEKYIWQQLPEAGMINPRRFIESTDTAVVEILGVIAPMSTPGQSFDVVVRPLSSTQTTSLNGGYLYTTDLKELSRVTQFNQYARTVARAQGPIFTIATDSADASNQWYVLGGGYSLSSTNISLLLNQPDFRTASIIRNRINERFGPKTAEAISPGEILLSIPEKYRYDKTRFVTMIRYLHLSDQPSLRDSRIETLLAQLQTETDKSLPEAELESIGKPAIDALSTLLEAEDPAVRFHAARCMSNIGHSRANSVLRDFVFDPQSPYRIDALRAIGRNAPRGDAEPILLRAMSDVSMDLRLAAYETALAAQSPIVTRTLVADNFFVDQIACGGPKTIYAKRQDNPGIVIFGAPLRCADNIFLRSDDGQVTLNARPDDKFISVSRTHPNRPRVIGPIASGFEITQLIRALAETPEPPKGRVTLPGLALSYSQIVGILEKMCQIEKIPAAFVAGPLTTAGQYFRDMQN